MSRRSYPRYGGEANIGDSKVGEVGPPCEFQDGRPSTRRVHVQVSWFRGEDETYACCADHAKLASQDLLAFLKAWHAAQPRPAQPAT